MTAVAEQTISTPVDEPRDPLLTDRQVAKLTGISAGTLRWWRHQGQSEGPKHFNLGPRAVRYKKSDVEAWIEEQYSQA